MLRFMYNSGTMQTFDTTRSRPLTLAASTEAQTYALFALAMGLTVVGVFIGAQYTIAILSGGFHMMLLIAELAIILTARFWMERSPLNYFLFGLFPLLSGITVAPFLSSVMIGYENGQLILLNALGATGFMAVAAAVFARVTPWDLGAMGRALFFALLGLIAFALLQIFVPSLRTQQAELIISGAGIVIFALFTAFDMQRIERMGKMGANPFLLALSLYLDIFNLFLYLLRFMIALSGNRR